ncbi:MAG: rRNA methylase [Candidatus Cloacimonetes bacterium HGW-Cloacimonetes-3]|jgi:TrmH family RNA methyltransferase|nr:MAG: rRNA methylase [Candidatus Cloacimonetes bacterium HGW-Cloacimonetes-3]
MPNLSLSIARIHSLAKLKQKKFRNLEQKVVVEGRRTLQQLADWGIVPEELYLAQGEPALPAKAIYDVTPEIMNRICDSESPPAIAGLYPLPEERSVSFRSAFYLDGISDPGNMGTIFRIAAAFGVDSVLLSTGCCELGSPKVIRASLGAVYKVPFRVCTPSELKALGATVITLDMAGSFALQDYKVPPSAYIMALGGEAHGLSSAIKTMADVSLRIDMPGEMESLNAAVCAGICAFQLCRK